MTKDHIISIMKYVFIFAVTLLVLFIVVYVVNLVRRKPEDILTSHINEEKSNINDDGESSGSKFKKAKITKLDIQAKEIQELINQKWVTRNFKIGTKESTFDGYDIYFDEGYEIKTIIGKTFNIVFTQNYSGNILKGIKVNTSFEDIIKNLGNPTFGEVTGNIIGYKGEDIYIFFSDKEVSVYRIDKEDSKNEFILLLNKFEKDGDVWELGNSLTDFWPDYDSYNYDTNYVELTYTLKGIKLQYNYTVQNGITIFNNYIGNIKEDMTIEQLIEDENKIPKYIYIEPRKDLVYEYEINRVNKNKFRYDLTLAEGEDEGIEGNTTKNFIISSDFENGNYVDIKIVSYTKEYPNSELAQDILIKSYLWYGDNILIYSISNKGIYAYNCVTRTTTTILRGQETFELKEIKENILKYDKKEIAI